MVFYETVHAGILRIDFNEQYLWAWFRKKDINPPQHGNFVRNLAYLVEGRLNEWDWNRPLILEEVISSVYYKFTHEK